MQSAGWVVVGVKIEMESFGFFYQYTMPVTNKLPLLCQCTNAYVELYNIHRITQTRLHLLRIICMSAYLLTSSLHVIVSCISFNILYLTMNMLKHKFFSDGPSPDITHMHTGLETRSRSPFYKEHLYPFKTWSDFLLTGRVAEPQLGGWLAQKVAILCNSTAKFSADKYPLTLRLLACHNTLTALFVKWHVCISSTFLLL